MIADCTGDGLATYWTPILFHFQILGWLLLVAYLIAIGAAGRRLRGEADRASLDRKAAGFWAVILILLVVLFFNRLFNFQAVATIAARCAAESEGWYLGRRPIQIALIVVTAAVALSLFVRAYLHRKAPDERLVLAGMAALIAFVAVRSVSLHWVDAYLRLKIFGLNFNGLTEGAALGLVLLGTIGANPALLIPFAPRATPAPVHRDSGK